VARRGMHLLFQQAGWLASGPQADDPTDIALLLAYLDNGDSAGMDALVRRHGPMVWATCKQMLPDPSEAEDAFQATFLVLVQSAKNLRGVKSLGGWLHGVAVKVCWKSRRGAARQKQRDAKSAKPEAAKKQPEPAWDGLYSAVHDEVEKLPATLRTAFVLCELQGHRPGDAATQLGWKLGTLSGRLTRARQQLMKKLTARGFAPLVVAAATATTAATAAMPLNETLLAAGAVIHHPVNLLPSTVLGLAKAITGGVTMKMKLVLATGVLITGLTVGLGWKYGNEVNAQGAAPLGAAPPGGTGGGGIPAATKPAEKPKPPALPAAGMGPGSDAPAGLPGTPGLPGPGGAAGGPPAGMTGGGGFSSPAPKPATPPVEHTMTNVPGSLNEMNRLLTQMGGDGWTFAGQVTLGDKDTKLVFTKALKASAYPPRDPNYVPAIGMGTGGPSGGYPTAGFGTIPGYDPATPIKTSSGTITLPTYPVPTGSGMLPSPTVPATTSVTKPRTGTLSNESKPKLKIEVFKPAEGTNLSSLQEIAMLVLKADASEAGLQPPSTDSVMITDTGHLIITGASPKALEAFREVVEKIEKSPKTGK
jgi:RNA polymerase sigma factor (sigma-70 family)